MSNFPLVRSIWCCKRIWALTQLPLGRVPLGVGYVPSGLDWAGCAGGRAWHTAKSRLANIKLWANGICDLACNTPVIRRRPSSLPRKARTMCPQGGEMFSLLNIAHRTSTRELFLLDGRSVSWSSGRKDSLRGGQYLYRSSGRESSLLDDQFVDRPSRRETSLLDGRHSVWRAWHPRLNSAQRGFVPNHPSFGLCQAGVGRVPPTLWDRPSWL